jgi:hypothetical protein
MVERTDKFGVKQVRINFYIPKTFYEKIEAYRKTEEKTFTALAKEIFLDWFKIKNLLKKKAK